MRAQFLILLGLFSFGAFAQTPVMDSFNWSDRSRVTMVIGHRAVPITITGEMRDGARGTKLTSKDGRYTVELKAYPKDLFVAVALTIENDENGYLFFTERPEETKWLVMNYRGIPTYNFEIIRDMDDVIEAFRKGPEFDLPNALRKTVEYFEKNPGKKLPELYAALRRDDKSLAVLPRPKMSPNSGNQGVIQQASPAGAGRAKDPFVAGNPDAQNYEQDEIAKMERERQAKARREARRQERLRREREQQGVPEVDQYGRPLPPQGQGYYPRGYVGGPQPMDIQPQRQQERRGGGGWFGGTGLW